MGLQIQLERVDPKARYGTDIEPWCTEHANGYDKLFEAYCLRENVFVRQDPAYEGWGDVPVSYWRPRNLDDCEDWIVQHVENDANAASYLAALDLMREDGDVYFYSSW